MSLFDMCCPRKPKKSLDYVIKWIENTDKTVKELEIWKNTIDSNISELVTEAIEKYPWDTLPDEALSHKADKVENATEGHFASLDSNGNLQDSNYNYSSFAPSTHSHSEIKAPGAFASHAFARIESGASVPFFHLKVGGMNDQSAQVEINVNNIENLKIALENPDTTPIQGSNHLITSGGVYNYMPPCIGDVVEGDQYAKIYASNSTQGDPNVIIELNDNNTPGGSVTKYATINIDNIDNLNRALKDPVKVSSSQSAYSDNKLITAAAVQYCCSSKLDKPDISLMAKFNVSGGTLTILDDTTEYDEIFDLVDFGVTTWHPMFVGIYNPVDDDYTPFFGVASINGQYSNIDSTPLEINVTIYIGSYTIYLNKNVSSGTITVSMDSFAAILQNSLGSITIGETSLSEAELIALKALLNS